MSFYAYPGCHSVAADGRKSGYGYDFMEMLAAKAGMKVEYVGYDRPWGDMFGMLECGELDVVDFVGWRPDRAEKMLFSARPMGYTGCSIRTLPENLERFSLGALDKWGRVRVGVLAGDQNEQEFRDFANDHGIDHEIVRFSTEAQGVEALRKGELDLVAYDGFSLTEGLGNVSTFNSCRNHLVTRRSDAALMARLDAAMAALDRDDPGWLARLRMKHYPVDTVVAYLPETNEFSDAMRGYLRALLTRLDEVLWARIVVKECRRDFSDADFSVPSFACGVAFTPENVRRFVIPQHSAGRRRADLLALPEKVQAVEKLLDTRNSEKLRLGYLKAEGDGFRRLFERYAMENGVAFEPLAAESEQALHEGLRKGRFDVILRPSCTEKEFRTVAECGHVDFFLAPPREQPGLAHMLSEALKYLRMDEPELIRELERRYFADRNDARRRVRLGAYVERGLSLRGEDGVYTGFVTEFSEAVARRAGWDLEVLSVTFPEAQRALRDGAIDLMGAAVWTPERAKVYDYSKSSMGPLYYALLKQSGGRMLENRPDTWQNARIGYQSGSLSIRDLEGFLAGRGVKWKAVAFNNLEEGERMVREGKLDAVYTLAHNDNRDLVPLAMLPTKLCYFCSNQRKPWIKQELDAAVDELVRENHRFVTDLYERHLSSTRGVLTLDADEIAFVSSRRGRKVKVSFCREQAPLVTVDRRTGRIGGLSRRMFDRFAERTGLEFEYFVNNFEAEVMLSVDGEHDGHEQDLRDVNWIKAPACWVKRQQPVAEARGVAAVMDDNGKDADFARRNGYRTRVFGTREECYRAVEEGRVETVIDGVAVARYLIDEQKSFSGLYHQAINLAVFSRPVTLYSRTTTDPRLRTILSKARDSLSADEYDTMLFESIYAERPMAVKLRTAFIVVLLVVVMAGIVVLVAHHNAKVANAANQAKTAFLNAMSHDIRTPMNAILGFTRMAKKKLEAVPAPQKDNGALGDRLLPDDLVGSRVPRDRDWYDEGGHAGRVPLPNADASCAAVNLAEVHDCLDKIDIAGNHLLELINEALDMGRIESGRVEIRPVPTDMPARFEALEVVFAPAAAKKGLEFKVDATGVVHQQALCDPMRVDQVLLNVVGNAIKYTKAGKVEVTATSEAAKPGHARYIVAISDTGPGIGEKFLKHIYEPFSREQTVTISGVQGSGLGMAIVKNTMQMMGGKIDIRSEVGKGTTVSLTFEFEMVAENSELGIRNSELSTNSSNPSNSSNLSNLSNLSNPFAGKRVLLVEDNELNREVATYVLKEQGFEVDVAENGKIAVEKVCGNEELGMRNEELGIASSESGCSIPNSRFLIPNSRYDFILMDIQMPVMDGYEATRAIREWEKGKLEIRNEELGIRNGELGMRNEELGIRNGEPGNSIPNSKFLIPNSHIPIIALSANAFAEDVAASLAAGMDGHVAKPIKVKELMAAIDKFKV